MQDLELIRSIRLEELKAALPFLPAGARVLELGAGAGWQAAALSGLGFRVVALETPSNHYPGQGAFPLTAYNGYSIPEGDAEFDAVFSSNVLEHVEDLGRLLQETRRVLKEQGVAVHILPTPRWRLWTNLTHPLWLMQRLLQILLGSSDLATASFNGGTCHRKWMRDSMANLLPQRHGERGNAWTELYYFSSGFWKRTFRDNDFDVEKIEPAGLFYVSAGIIGKRLPLSARSRLACWLGSTCTIYVLRKRNDRRATR